jgi:hypothetical protein
MIVNSALLLLVRALSMALLAMVGGKWALAYFVSDMGLYFGYRLVRKDLWHWIPVDGVGGVVAAVLERLVVKVLVDYTGVIQFRGSGEMGAAYFSFNMMLSLAASFVITRIYYATLEDGTEPMVDESRAWAVVGSLSGAWVLVFAIFLLSIKHTFWSTFFSTQSGHAWAKARFTKSDTDELKAWIFGCNKKQWKSIRDDVKAWTLENWERWEEEKPAWFNDAWKKSIDDDMIPAESLRRLKVGGSARRRSSLGDVLGLSGAPAQQDGGAAVVPVA